MKYLPLIRLGITHDYYSDDACPDFRVEADEQTGKTLKNHRCILKMNPTGFLILQAVNKDDDKPFIEIPFSTRLRFKMALSNSDFLHFTDLRGFPDRDLPVFSNQGINGGILKMTPGSIREKKGDFASMELFINNLIRPAQKDPVHYRIPFKARFAHWEYFFITNKKTNDSIFRIKHIKHQEGDSPDSGPLIFNQETPNKQAITDWVKTQHPEARLLYFVSDKPVRCRQAPRKNIQLLLNGERLLNNLPNPSFRDQNQRTIEDGNTKPTQATFFKIVKYMEQSLSTTGI